MPDTTRRPPADLAASDVDASASTKPALPSGAGPAGESPSPPAAKAQREKSAPQKAMEKLGLARDIDLALHLPLRYEDETRVTRIADLRDGDTAQVEGVVSHCEIEMRPRRQLVVRIVDADGFADSKDGASRGDDASNSRRAGSSSWAGSSAGAGIGAGTGGSLGTEDIGRDDCGRSELFLRFIHFYPGHRKTLAVGTRLRIRGEARGGFFGLEMVHPVFKVVQAETPLATSLTPVYPSTATLPQNYLRKAIASGLQRADLGEVLPPDLLPSGSMGLRAALEFLHHPPPSASLDTLQDQTHPAWQRLKFEELLAQQLSQLQAKRERALQRAPLFEAPAGALHEQLLATLPFDLTPAQRRVVEEIAGDLARPANPVQGSAERPSAEAAANTLRQQGGGSKPALQTGALRHGPANTRNAPSEGPPQALHLEASSRPADARQQLAVPMHRLLQGDVGSGKTVVAALAAAIVIAEGWQCALMAPTEILAEQHFAKLVEWLDPLLQPLGIEVAWLTGSRKGKARAAMVERVASGKAGLVIGTHAVIQDHVRFAKLGLAIVDEQHRFGVQQRLALRDKLAAHEAADHGTLEPHLLMMSATPIPRTLAMTLFADLDVSTIDELPPGRTPIVTKLFSLARRDDVVRTIAGEVARGRQVYWVCPLIEESEAGPDASAAQQQMLELKNVTDTHRELGAALPGHSVGLLHGRMPPADKAAAMAQFTSGQTAVLVATTVIEVGVDVPNASLMVIEHAERFGLSQLHQLRGRVGRGSVASVCVLLYGSPLSDTGKARLKAMIETNDGFEIARRDLEIRGPGEFLGARQSGAPLLRFADMVLDEAMVQQARDAACALLDRDEIAAARHVARWLGGKSQYMKA